MKITALSLQQRTPDRVNVFIDGKYRLSLSVQQVADTGIKIDMELDEAALEALLVKSQFGKVYQRTLEYALMRPRSEKEVRDYLWKRTRARPYRTRTGETHVREGIDESVAADVLTRLVEKGYIDDYRFTEFWVEHRHQKKGVSQRKLRAELQLKGVASGVVDEVLAGSERNDSTEIQKIIAKKRAKYDDDQKFMAYLARQGFRYDEIRDALDAAASES